MTLRFGKIRRRVILAVTAALLTGGGAATTIWDRGGADASPVPTQPAEVVAEVNALLSRTPVLANIAPADGYERECGIDKKTKKKQACSFGRAWNDPDDHSGCDTRNRVLAIQLSSVTFKQGTRNCKVISGWVIDPYSGKRVELAQIGMDHIVPLRRAYDSGANNWDLLTRQRFANDPNNLLAVSRSLNSSKSDSGPAQWTPPDPTLRCGYSLRYLRVIDAYRLPISVADQRAIQRVCGISGQQALGQQPQAQNGGAR
ncbi:HNH endonuclease [Mycolicibacterium fortuitum]|uniref:HNH endonuclease family protein n=1 Tax=Mycolicibacterium fortuitum TaxID=1766 RepID=UPI001CDC2D91|nr:HNH endonuclease family protein [Mycolicibacterium fortuitum]UBV20407.1 HNH endonuclease [Mycolicibacterium fortuitum]